MSKKNQETTRLVTHVAAAFGRISTEGGMSHSVAVVANELNAKVK